MSAAEAKSRSAAVENFRAQLRPEAAQNLRAEVNEAGALKNFFINGGPLSAPQQGAPDVIDRGFLKRHGALFVLSDDGVNGLELLKEDNDAGTTFLDYAQTVGGLKVFEGNVKVVVNKEGQVLSVREGFLVTGQQVKLRPRLDEAQGIAAAFRHAGRRVLASGLAETRARLAQRQRRLRRPARVGV